VSLVASGLHKRVGFECFPHVCPEPVAVKMIGFIQRVGHKKPFSRFLTGGRASAPGGVAKKCGRPSFLGAFPMFVPSLSWYNDAFYRLYKFAYLVASRSDRSRLQDEGRSASGVYR
jgi:hypothetical protein